MLDVDDTLILAFPSDGWSAPGVSVYTDSKPFAFAAGWDLPMTDMAGRSNTWGRER